MTDAHDRYYEQAKAMLWELNAHVCREDDDGLCFKCMGILTDGLATAAQPVVWTTEKPTTPGWYWYKNGGRLSVWHIRIGDGKRTELWAYQPQRIDDGHGIQLFYFKGGEFAGPLQPPKEKKT